MQISDSRRLPTRLRPTASPDCLSPFCCSEREMERGCSDSPIFGRIESDTIFGWFGRCCGHESPGGRSLEISCLDFLNPPPNPPKKTHWRGSGL